jgi:hypothetical protein
MGALRRTPGQARPHWRNASLKWKHQSKQDKDSVSDTERGMGQGQAVPRVGMRRTAVEADAPRRGGAKDMGAAVARTEEAVVETHSSMSPHSLSPLSVDAGLVGF